MLFNRLCVSVYIKNITSWRYIQNRVLMRSSQVLLTQNQLIHLAMEEESDAKLTIQNHREPGRSAGKCTTGNWKTVTNDWNGWRESNVKVKWEWLIRGYKAVKHSTCLYCTFLINDTRSFKKRKFNWWVVSVEMCHIHTIRGYKLGKGRNKHY